MFRDTVNSVGIIPRRLPFTSSNSSIRTFRHALSLDEHRAKFKANVYHRSTEAEKKLGTKAGEMPKAGALVVASQKEAKDGKSGEKHNPHHHRHKSFRAYEAEFDKNEANINETDVLEVWFAGCHTGAFHSGVVNTCLHTCEHHIDVGGGSVSNSSQHNLARIPLRWMIRQCFLTNTGILFHGKLLQAIGLDPSSLHPVVKPRPPALSYSATPTTPASTTKMTGTTKTLVNPRDSNLSTFKGDTISVGYIDVSPSSIGVLSEEEEDLADSLCRIYDQLRIAPLWWILEFFPTRQPTQRDDNNTWVQNLM